MPMMASQILKSGFDIFSSNKKYKLHIKCYLISKNSFVKEVTFKKTKY